MAEQALVQARMDKELRDEVADIYDSLGLDIPTAIRMFFTRTKMVRGIPFDTTLPENTITRTEAFGIFNDLRAQASDVPEMTLDEINAAKSRHDGVSESITAKEAQSTRLAEFFKRLET